MQGKPQIVVTIDVEPDRQWSDEPVLCLENLVRLPELHALLRDAGARPTYLATYSVCCDEVSGEMLARFSGEGGCEVGAHLHPWDTPPLLPDDSLPGPKPFPTELGADLLRTKLHSLTEIIAERIGAQPDSYRAGRWGLDGSGLSILEEFGYRVDSSVTPLHSWAHQRGRAEGSRGPCFKTAPLEPYHPDHQDICKPGRSSVLEVPVSVGFARFVPQYLRDRYQAAPDTAFLARLMRRRPFRPIWFRPTFASARTMTALGERLLGAGVPVLNMAFHSSELLPSANPYFHTEDQVDAFLRRVERTLSHFLRRGVVAATLNEVRPPHPVPRSSQPWRQHRP